MKLFKKKFKSKPWIQERQVKRSINQFFQNEDIIRQSLEITNVIIRQTKKKLTITITLERPGLIIGKGGKIIDSLKKYLEMLYEIEITILILESKLWY